jgi:transaldolase
MRNRAAQLNALGQSVWLDFIRRGHIASGKFDPLVQAGDVVGVTSNPTIFQQAIADGDDYDRGIEQRIGEGLSGTPLFESIMVEDIRLACERLSGVFERTGQLDGRVSIEVNPHLANDTKGSIDEARRLRAAVDRPNVMIKVPATRAGLPAITQLTAEGLSINITLIFSNARYREVIEAYLLGLERRAAAGQPLGDIRSVASFFVSRVDTKVDKAIEARLKGPAPTSERAALESFRGQAAVANARLAYAVFREAFAGPRWSALAAKSAHLQRPLWASTSTKNPVYRDVVYVEELIGPDTVNTMPLATLEAFNDHGVVEERITRDLDQARLLFQRLPALGVPVDDLIAQLEDEGVVAFQKSFDAALETLENKRLAIQGTRG